MDKLTLLSHPLTQRCSIGVVPLAIDKMAELELAPQQLIYQLGDAEIKWRQTTEQLFVGDKLYFKPSPKPIVDWFVESLKLYIELMDSVCRKGISSDFLLMTSPDFFYSDDFRKVADNLSDDMDGRTGILPIIHSTSAMDAKFISRDLSNFNALIQEARIELCAIAQLPPSDLFGVDFSSTFSSSSQNQLTNNSVSELVFKWRLWLANAY
jgi:hypothetical protein